MKSLVVLALSSLCPIGSALAENEIRFNRDIRPILSENCFFCHGPDKNARQAGLRLDRREAALESGAIQPGNPEAGKLAARIRTNEPALRMPPVWSGKALTEEQKGLLLRWVAQGAEYEPHWAYIRPSRPKAPDGPRAVDFLIEKELHRRGLQPVGEADRRTLAQRVSADLTGLPVTPEVAEHFAKDRDPEAYQKLVDRFLSSPHFGERMAVHWLDLVRYADTSGFHSDGNISVSPYRDYVIRAFNDNLPFDQFTREQLAGDLLPDASEWQRVASAYNRLNRMTNEGGAQEKEYLAKYAADRVRNVSIVWLGSTLGCAECHDHKFDPFTTKDFYQMAAFFADVEEKGVYGINFGASVRVPSAEAIESLEKIDLRLKELREDGRGELPTDSANLVRFAEYLSDQLKRWRVLTPSRVWGNCDHPEIEGCENYEIRLEEGGFVQLVPNEGKKVRGAVQQVRSRDHGGETTALLLEVFASETFEEFFLSEFRVQVLSGNEDLIVVPIETLLPDQEKPGSMLRETQDDSHQTGWGGRPTQEQPRRAVFVLEEPLNLKQDESLLVTMTYNGIHGEKVAGRLRLSVTNSAFPEIPPSGDLANALRQETGPAQTQSRALKKAFVEITENKPHWREIRALERRKKTLLDLADECLVTQAVDAPRVVRVLPRGNWMDDSGEIVKPQAPHFLAPIVTHGNRLTRLALANWLVDLKNPLTARVFVNRIWELFFGTGLSKALEDLGSRGESPVNQELLDCLAVEFVQSGWDMKHIIRTIVLSQTYRRSSEATPELLAVDPYNRLLGRQSARRLEAEFIRDQALAVSGLMSPTIGGRSVRPYQPAGYYQELNFPKREYRPDLDANQFRRGLYTHWQRTFLHPSLMAFDAPSREECTAERTVSNTPLQSLVLLNDPTYVEAAKAFAVRLLTGRKDDIGRLDFAFLAAFSRPSKPRERAVLLRLLESARRRFRKEPERAEKLLGTGISPVPSDLDSTEVAAWTSVARALFNKHEFVVRY